MQAAIHYTLTPSDPKGHLFDVTLSVQKPSLVQQVKLPNWIPGSYLIRDFSKHLIGLQAFDHNKQPLAITCLDKSTWQFSSQGKAVTLTYQVYAWDLSVRGAHFDESHAFFNGTSVFLAVEGQREQVCSLEILNTPHSKQQYWKVATGMPATQVNSHGFGFYQAESYDALIDYPVEMGTFTEIDFIACGIPHKMVLTGLFDCDEARLKADLTKICEAEIKLFGLPAPMESYLFQVMVTGTDYGGLEHRNSTALLCSRTDLPYKGMDKPTEAYIKFLGLCSHEYFHTWNVKRIQPKVFQTTDLSLPAYTEQLWWFEGVTSYYDDLILLQAGLVDQAGYLELLAQQMTRVYRMPGRFKQSVAQSSWLTWTKFYQQDENAPNAIISYYTKGCLIALGLDLTIRAQTQGQKSLDDVLLYLWHAYGSVGIGLEEGEIEKRCDQVTGLNLSEFFTTYVHGTEDLPFESLFAAVGIEFSLRAPSKVTDAGGNNSADAIKVHLGANLMDSGFQSVKVANVWLGQPAHQAGLSAGDEIIAINHIKTPNVGVIENMLTRCDSTTSWRCHFFRRDELRQVEIIIEPPILDRVVLTQNSRAKAKNIHWLEDHSAVRERHKNDN